MVFFNYALRKLNAKIVYYGPGLCGKTTNLVWIHDHFEGGDRGKMISLATEGDRTIFFDLLPLEIGSIRGMDVTLQLYTVPGQVHYNSTRQLVLRGADGVVFVADSQRAMQSSNIESFRNLQENLLLQGISLEGFPLALQFNKRDLKDVRTVEELDSDLNVFRVPIFEAVATKGVGVQETLEGIVKLVMRSLRERYEGAAAEARSPGAGDPAATMRVPSAPRTPPAVPPRAPAPAPPAPEPPRAAPAPPPKPKPAPPTVAPPSAAPVQRVPEARPPAQVRPPVSPRPAPAPPERPTVFPEAATPPPVRPRVPAPVDEIVFPEDDGAATRDFSRSAGPAPDVRPPGRGFEDEVSTAVYEVGDEIEIGPDDFSSPNVDGDVFTSTPERSFVDEVTKTEVEARAEIEPPRVRSETPAFESRAHPEAPLPESSSPFDEPLDADEPVIEFMTDDVRRDMPPPTADVPPPSDRYVDRIVAPSPFAPYAPSSDAAPPAADAVSSSGQDLAFGVDEDREAVAALTDDIVVDESSDHAIEVPEEAGPQDAAEMPAFEMPFTAADEDLFASPETPTHLAAASPRQVAVRAEDNQLHLRLHGTGAIVESGQVRELDIEVPVPGSWVGNRRVTLQLRLTLTPDTEDDNGGSGETS
jgi:GTPase SAR1 family protein